MDIVTHTAPWTARPSFLFWTAGFLFESIYLTLRVHTPQRTDRTALLFLYCAAIRQMQTHSRLNHLLHLVDIVSNSSVRRKAAYASSAHADGSSSSTKSNVYTHIYIYIYIWQCTDKELLASFRGSSREASSADLRIGCRYRVSQVHRAPCRVTHGSYDSNTNFPSAWRLIASIWS